MPGLSRIQAAIVRGVVAHVDVAGLAQVAGAPGVRAAYRIVVHYHDGRAHDSVATLIDHLAYVRLELVYRLAFGGKPLVYSIPAPRLHLFARLAASVDTLDDQPDLPLGGVDLWLIERAVGPRVRGVIVSPALPAVSPTDAVTADPYAALIGAVVHHLPEALRELRV